MSDDGSGLSDMEAAESTTERTPRDYQRDGPVRPDELLPAGPPVPRPVWDTAARDDHHALREGRLEPDSDDSEGSRPERRWPVQNGDRVQGPFLPNGRFCTTSTEDSCSAAHLSSPSGASSMADSSDDNHGMDRRPDDRDDDRSDASSTWSATTLVLVENCLVHAKNVLLGCYRQQLVDTVELTARQQGGRVGALRRQLRDRDWTAVQEAARRLLDGPRLERWQDYEYRSTHQRRPRRPAEELVFGAVSAFTALTPPRARLRAAKTGGTFYRGQRHSEIASEQTGIHGLARHARYAGVLVLLSRAHFLDPAVHEAIGGRVIHVRAKLKQSGVTVDILATYQHVWRSHLSLLGNRELRNTVWDAMDTIIASLPSRNLLVACGDYNTNLRPCLPHVGTAVGTQGQATARIDKARLIQAATGSNPDGEALQALVAGKLQQVSTADPHELHAQEAASCGDQRTLYQIVRSLAPASSRLFSRLRDTQGNFLTKHEEVRALVAQGKTTYSLHADRPVAGVLSGSIDLTDEEITQQFRKIKAAKAVPSHLAHAAAWKICASSLGPLFGDSLRQHLVQGHAGLLHGDLTDAQMVMLPKAGKSPHILAHLRPIGLMGPPSKAIAGALRNRMLAQLGQLIRFRPQFAYTAER
ncbi:unnamed protein product, partial [Symbiodinium sp. CCMP2456]